MHYVHKEDPYVYSMLYMHLFEDSLQIKGNVALFYKFVDPWKRLQEVYLNIPTLYILLSYMIFSFSFVYVLKNDILIYHRKLNSNKIHM